MDQMIVPETAPCPPHSRFPTVEEFNEGLGMYAIGMYVFCAVVIAILALRVRKRMALCRYTF